MEPTTPTVTNNKSKIAIVVIIILIIIAGMIAIMSRKGKTVIAPINNAEVQVQNGKVSASDDSGILTQEITEATTFDNEADLSAIDKAF
jgi:hypothetical protein